MTGPIKSLFMAAVLTFSGAQTSPPPETLERAYRDALAVSPAPRALEARWRLFQEDLAGAPDEDTAELVADMTVSLRQLGARDASLRALRLEREALFAGCIDMGLLDCRSRTGEGVLASGVPIYSQIQQGHTEEDGTISAHVVLLPRQGRLVPLVWTAGAARYEAPAIFSHEDVAYIALPGIFAGSGEHNADALWAVSDDLGTREIDVWSWTEDVGAHLPVGFDIRKGVDFDWPRLQASTALWQPRDANCCPTGGRALIRFAIENERLIVRGVRVWLEPVEAGAD